MHFISLCFALSIFFSALHSVEASKSKYLQQLGGSGDVISALDDRLQRELTALLPEGTNIKHLNGKLLHGQMGSASIGLIVDGKRLHIFRHVPASMLQNRDVTKLGRLDSSRRLSLALSSPSAGSTPVFESKAAGVGHATKPKVAGKAPSAKKATRTLEVPGFAKRQTPPRAPTPPKSEEFVSKKAKKVDGEWKDIHGHESVTATLVSFLDQEAQLGVAAASPDSWRLIRQQQLGAPLLDQPFVPEPAKAAEMHGTMSYLGVPLDAQLRTFRDPSKEAVAAYTRRARSKDGLVTYQGAIVPDRTPQTASKNKTTSGGAGAEEEAELDTAIHENTTQWLPQGSGVLSHKRTGDQTSRRDEVLRGIFNTTTEGRPSFTGDYLLSNRSSYRGTMEFVDGAWRRVGKGTERSTSQAYRLEGNFQSTGDGRAIATNATMTLSSGELRKGTALQIVDHWVMLTDPHKLPSLPQKVEYLTKLEDNVDFVSKEHFRTGNVYQRPEGGYYIGNVAHGSDDKLRRSGPGQDLEKNGIWTEANYETEGSKAALHTRYFMDGSTFSENIIFPNDVPHGIGPAIRIYENGASLTGTFSENLRATGRRPVYIDPDGTMYRGSENSTIQYQSDEWWPMGQGELRLADGRIITGNFSSTTGAGGAFQPSTGREAVTRRIIITPAKVTFPDGSTWKGRVEKRPEGWIQTEKAPSTLVTIGESLLMFLEAM